MSDRWNRPFTGNRLARNGRLGSDLDSGHLVEAKQAWIGTIKEEATDGGDDQGENGRA